ncbi:MAG TPA: hypothetical protein VMD59_20720 [Acidimicrobiales bacterium]|nr:hypothetical protein [Acidimicrobiales bacterium]
MRSSRARRCSPAALGAVLAASGLASAGHATTSPATFRHELAARAVPFLSGLDTVSTIASTIPQDGDENPYAVLVAPVSSGAIRAGDLLVDDFNSVSNLQGTGTTILIVTPGGTARTFARVPRHLRGCPGGVGLTTAMAELRDGWVLVGSAPTSSGTTATAGRGCLVVLTTTGRVAGAISGPEIDGPWDMACIDDGSRVTLLMTNTLLGVRAPPQHPVERGDLVRVTLRVSPASPPSATSSTVVASGFPEQPDVDSRLVVGPTGVVVASGTAYIADTLANRIVAVPDAITRTNVDREPPTVSSGGLLAGPLGMALAPDGDLIVANARNGDLVEITRSGRQVAHVAVDPDPAQSPPGDGDLFGVAVTTSPRGVYFGKDDTNTLALLH